MANEMRREKNYLTIYTDDKFIYNLLKKTLRDKHRIPYYQNGKVIAVDLYYDIRFASALKAILKGQIPMLIENH